MKKAIPLLLALLLLAGCAREAASAPEVAFVPSVTIRRMDVLAEASLNQTDRITVAHALEEQGYSNAQAEIVADAMQGERYEMVIQTMAQGDADEIPVSFCVELVVWNYNNQLYYIEDSTRFKQAYQYETKEDLTIQSESSHMLNTSNPVHRNEELTGIVLFAHLRKPGSEAQYTIDYIANFALLEGVLSD